ncbi:hypothetical protein K437DRAFT_184281 [Tilletiaria anomala UBC 951]|uniref:Small EDRK-rich factor-like N-terminal domain-containing protein n=1 Tax=Tilletiaria anomala (strain ATCC 24038 / CBS 436.72 / UBC 951) TaxID=1037660 RepID=A0A066VH45_TILAU|nr:uncharacterized protein K437DRAFT_184281 [Tilletiaria anomala UBC 951]KDN40796.1 hypothetical protein K437DRAFT_184281 [Tilletiaria anomala UBC 951]
MLHSDRDFPRFSSSTCRLRWVSTDALLNHLGCSQILSAYVGGNQRDRDREKAQKKAADQNKGKQKMSASSLAQKREADAEAVRKKMEVSSLWDIHYLSLRCKSVS